jgi:hypothetical protein
MATSIPSLPLQGTIARFERQSNTGEIKGATMRLENGLSGFIYRGNVSDAPFADIEECLEVDQIVKARVLDISKARLGSFVWRPCAPASGRVTLFS